MGHIPQRMCVICRSRCAKAQLIRRVAGADGEWLTDTRQRLPGRGLYICTQDHCRQRFEAMCKKRHKRR